MQRMGDELAASEEPGRPSRAMGYAAGLLAATLAGCGPIQVNKNISVTSDPAQADIYTCIDEYNIHNHIGKTPVHAYFYYWGTGVNSIGAVSAVRPDCYPRTAEFAVGQAPETLHFDLVPLPTYTFTLDTIPSGASVETQQTQYLFDPRAKKMVPLGEPQWILVGNTPHAFEKMLDEGDGIISFRLMKPGFEERVVNLRLGEPNYRIELGEK